MAFAELGQVYAEIVRVCQPFYELPKETPTSASSSTSSTAQEEGGFYLHPLLEDGLLLQQQQHQQGQQGQQQRQDLHSRLWTLSKYNTDENPQDPTAACHNHNRLLTAETNVVVEDTANTIMGRHGPGRWRQ